MNERTSRIAADERNVDVWLVFYDEISDPRLHSSYREMLTDEERSREGRFYFPDDRKRYLLTRALVRAVLSRYVAVAPAHLRFSTNRYGRPEVANAPQEYRLCFNVSHTRGLIALGVAQGRELGIDVEDVQARQGSIELADRFFAAEEVAELRSVPRERFQERFFEYWTFKESYIKARGMGLSIPLEHFSFHFPHERAVGIRIKPQLCDDADRWCFWQLRPTPEYLLALCVERGSNVPSLTVRRVIPLVIEELVQPEWLKSSEPL